MSAMIRCEMTMTTAYRATLLLPAIAVLALGFGSPAAANDTSDGMSWVRWPGQTNQSNTQPTYDRSAVRAWESQPPKGFPTLGTENAAAMRKAVALYQDIVARGGFPVVPEGQGTLSVGMFGGTVAIVKERLALSGDLREPDNDGSANFDYALEKAVKRFQASNGLTPTGIVDKRTVAAMNVPAAARLKQLQTNAQRITDLNRGLPQRYILVNIPAAQIEAVEGDEVASRHSGVVGKLDRQTPVLRSSVHQLNFNPVWHLPPTVINKDLIPKGIEAERRGQDLLAKMGIDAYGSDGRKIDSTRVRWSAAAGYSFKQQPGRENPLGFVKLNFPNSHATYMHATSSDTLFGRNFRAASSGCVRIAGIETLVAWILRDQGGWDLQRVLRMKETGERLDVSLKRPMPVYWSYITAWATADGVIQFRRDLYEKDGVGPVAAAY